MFIKNRTLFMWGLGLALSFIAVLLYMFTPSFGENKNAFEASDQMFNSISKGSINYIPSLMDQAKTFDNSGISELKLKLDGEQIEVIEKILNTNAISTSVTEQGLTVDSSLDEILRMALQDSLLMFNNNGTAVSDRYGINEKKALYTWWLFLKNLDLTLKMEKRFKEASFTNEVMVKAVEVGYNYYGIEPQSAKSQVWLLTFALIFYVLYTIWWGYAIFFLFESFGLAMTAGSKKEV